MKYKVINLKDQTYQVVNEQYEVFFQGSIADCEAWIRLTEGGYL